MPLRLSPVRVCLLSLLLSACSAPPSAPDSAENAKLSAEVDKMFRDYPIGSDTSPQAKVARYLTQVQKAISAKIDQSQSYQGQRCSVRLALQRDGTVDNATVEIASSFQHRLQPVSGGVKRINIKQMASDRCDGSRRFHRVRRYSARRPN